MNTLGHWNQLVAEVNGRTFLGKCHSDGHYLCVECSQLSPEAPRFVDYGRDGRRDRLVAFFATLKARASCS